MTVFYGSKNKPVPESFFLEVTNPSIITCPLKVSLPVYHQLGRNLHQRLCSYTDKKDQNRIHNIYLWNQMLRRIAKRWGISNYRESPKKDSIFPKSKNISDLFSDKEGKIM